MSKNTKVVGNENLKTFYNDIKQVFPQYIELTWQELKDLRDNSKLIKGATYRITDYKTTTTQIDTDVAGHNFDILVVADDVNVLNENARAIAHDGDTYFSHEIISVEVKYRQYKDEEVDKRSGNYWNHRQAFDMVGYIDNTPVIYINNSEHRGQTSNADYYKFIGTFEFENKTYDRWQYFEIQNDSYEQQEVYVLTDIIVDEQNKIIKGKITKSVNNLSSWELKYCLDNDITRFLWASASGKGVIYYMKDEFNNECPYDFKNILFKRYKIDDGLFARTLAKIAFDEPDYSDAYVGFLNGEDTMFVNLEHMESSFYYTFSFYLTDEENVAKQIRDASINASDFENVEYTSSQTKNNVIKSYKSFSKIDSTYSNIVQALNNIVIVRRTSKSNTDVIGSLISNNFFDSDCHDMHFFSKMENCSIGRECYNVVCGMNTNTKLGNECDTIVLGNMADENKIGDKGYKIEIGNNSFGNSIDKNCTDCLINGTYNTIGMNNGVVKLGSTTDDKNCVCCFTENGVSNISITTSKGIIYCAHIHSGRYSTKKTIYVENTSSDFSTDIYFKDNQDIYLD